MTPTDPSPAPSPCSCGRGSSSIAVLFGAAVAAGFEAVRAARPREPEPRRASRCRTRKPGGVGAMSPTERVLTAEERGNARQARPPSWWCGLDPHQRGRRRSTAMSTSSPCTGQLRGLLDQILFMVWKVTRRAAAAASTSVVGLGAESVRGACRASTSRRCGVDLLYNQADSSSSAGRRTKPAGRCCSTSGCGRRQPPPEAGGDPRAARRRSTRRRRSSGASTCATVAVTTDGTTATPKRVELEQDGLRRATAVARRAARGPRSGGRRSGMHVPRAVGGPEPARHRGTRGARCCTASRRPASPSASARARAPRRGRRSTRGAGAAHVPGAPPGLPVRPRGERSIARAYVKAFGRARRLMYLEDQYLWSFAAAEALAAALAARARAARGRRDPALPRPRRGARGDRQRGSAASTSSTRCDAAGGDRVAVYDLENPAGDPVYVHSKVCIVDDVWMAVGSDNLNRRSWTHDSELSCAVLDAGATGGAGGSGRDGRRRRRAPAPTPGSASRREHAGITPADVATLVDPKAWFDALRSRPTRSTAGTSVAGRAPPDGPSAGARASSSCRGRGRTIMRSMHARRCSTPTAAPNVSGSVTSSESVDVVAVDYRVRLAS